ncbi:MAG: hypothetical protein K2P59_05950, partial [Acetatifactor sp.]|nr:hypothetical protein [Acetatifactor sp.]
MDHDRQDPASERNAVGKAGNSKSGLRRDPAKGRGRFREYVIYGLRRKTVTELYADVIVDISHEKLDKSFQYRVPERLRETLDTGMCVTIPFGNGNKLIRGYVIGLGGICKFDPARTKDIHDIVQN